MTKLTNPYRSLVLGGVKSGKSRYAEQLATNYCADGAGGVTLIATAHAGDDEMRARIERHKAERDKDWLVIEEPNALGSALARADQSAAYSVGSSCIVIDCLTLWITNLLMKSDEKLLMREIDSFMKSVVCCQSRLIMVSNETNMGITPMGELSRQFCDETGLLHQALGRNCDHVCLMAAGIALDIKGFALPGA